MIKIDANLLEELGLGGLPPDVAKDLLRHIYETLEVRVGVELANAMTNDQLEESEVFFDANDNAGAFRWLETNFPNYKDIVHEQYETLKQEISANAEAILASVAT